MKEITLFEALNPLSKRTLKTIRDEANIYIPEYYIISTRNLLLAMLFYASLVGVSFASLIYHLIR